MKKFFVFLLIAVFAVLTNPAQALTPFWYNGVALDAAGQIRDLATVDVRITIYNGTTPIYTQTISGVLTNQFAGFSVYVNGAIGAINADADMMIKAEVQDVSGNWILSSIQTLAYALENSTILPGNINLTQNYIIIGDASNNGQGLPVGGELTGTNTGAAASLIINNNAITNAKMADNAIGNAEMLDGAIGTIEIQNDAVTAAKINLDVAGNGMI